MSSANRRRNYFIKKEFQASFFLKFAVLLFLEAVLIAALFMFISRGTLTTAYHGTELTIQKTGPYFFLNFILITSVVGVSMALAGALVFMYLSHRLGGPLYKFEKTIEEAAKGDITQRMHLRHTDQLLDLRDCFNAFLEGTDKRISRIKSDVAKSMELIEKNKTRAAADNVRELLKKIKSSLDHFKTSK
ncbi:MAG: methyl-accepting chemotaxis protein [Candidatus Omnitrophica bacterium]|nr:methyl-accepting chemotaxis protein [Candidatus Omnitrophota bacterium]